jgi:hypothetical protein
MRQKPVALYAACFLSFTGVFALTGQRESSLSSSITVTEVMENRIDMDDTMTPYEEALLNPRKIAPLPPEKIDSETLWLARAIFSETKRPEEQVLVAWVIRNRVETRYRGQSSYRNVVLDPYQFSAFIPTQKTESYYTSLTPHSRVAGWKTALRIADHVRKSAPDARPFTVDTRHFYSEQSMLNGSAPRWAEGRRAINNLPYTVDQRRFRFFAGVT